MKKYKLNGYAIDLETITIDRLKRIAPRSGAFAEACFDQNTIDELKTDFNVGDVRDMHTWNICIIGWRVAIQAAINSRMELDERELQSEAEAYVEEQGIGHDED